MGSALLAHVSAITSSIITLAKESHDPCKVADALWRQVATEGILYGIQAISVTKKVMTELDSIQAGVGAFILGVRRTCSHEAIRKELGWKSMSAIIYTRKLQYWGRLASLDKENWAYKAYQECLGATGKGKGAAWLSQWRAEIIKIMKECEMSRPFGYHKNRKKSIKIGVERWEERKTKEALKGSSLKGMPLYKKSNKIQGYIDYNEASVALAKFRLGDAKLGNRESPAIKDCRLCLEGEGNNNEAHIVFKCETVNAIIEDKMPALRKFKEKYGAEEDENKKLRLLLGGDKCKTEELLIRGKQLADLLEEIQDMLNECEFGDMRYGKQDSFKAMDDGVLIS